MSRAPAQMTWTARAAIKLAAISVLLFSPLLAGETSAQYSVAAWGHKDGLPSTLINSIAQSPDGFLWLGTDDGLVRFDGVQFTQWRPAVPNSQLPGQVRTLHVSRQGELLLGTESGLFGRIRNGALDVTQTEAGVREIQDAADGSYWVATAAALWHLAAKNLQPVEPSIPLPREWVSGPLQTGDGREWIATHAGLFYVQAGRLVQATDSSRRLLVAPGGHPAWLDEEGALHSLETGKVLVDSKALSPYSSAISTIMTDSSGSLWVGTRGNGVLRYSTSEGRSTLQRYMRSDGLSSDFIRSLFEDAEHNIWVGTENGLERLRRNRVVSLTMRDGLLSDAIDSIAAGKDGSVWLATADGLERLLDDHKSADRRGIPILSLLISRDQELWAGTATGLMHTRGGRLAPSGKDAEFRAVTALAEDQGGVLWFYDASQGVFQQSSGRDPVPITSAALLHHTVTAMASGPGGAVWFGLVDGSIVEEVQGKFHTYSTRDGLSGGTIHGLSLGPDGELWAATEWGLCFLDGNGFRCRHRSSGLPGDRVLWVAPDAHRNLWLGYNIGVAEINAEEVRQTKGKATSELSLRFFDDADGITNGLALNGNAPAVFTHDGRLWLTTSQGLVVIDPEHLYTNVLPPPVHVLAVESDGNAVDLTRPVKLPPLTRSIHFSFAGLSLAVPRKVRFRYKLEPFDGEWRDGGSSREVSYTNLPPGHYIFRVRASNNDGVWNETGAALSFFLAPAYFQTLWFRLLCVAAVLLGAVFFFRLRLRSAQQMIRLRFEERMEERTRIAQELHDHLIQEMVGIGMQLEVADELTPGSADAKTPLQRALMLSRSAIANGRLTLQTLRQPRVTGAALVESLRRTAEAYPEENRAPVEYRVDGNERLLRPETAEDLCELAAEALRNALKHAGKGTIHVELRYGSATLELTVRDEGEGMTDHLLQAGTPGHYGLAGMRERAARMGADISIISSPGQGTTVRVSVPAARAYQNERLGEGSRGLGGKQPVEKAQ